MACFMYLMTLRKINNTFNSEGLLLEEKKIEPSRLKNTSNFYTLVFYDNFNIKKILLNFLVSIVIQNLMYFKDEIDFFLLKRNFKKQKF